MAQVVHRIIYSGRFELLKMVEFFIDFGKMPMNLSEKSLGAISNKTIGIY